MGDSADSKLFQRVEKMLNEDEVWNLDQLETHARAHAQGDVYAKLDASARLVIWKRRVELDYPPGQRTEAYEEGFARVLGVAMSKAAAYEIERLWRVRHRIVRFVADEIAAAAPGKPVKAKALSPRALWERCAPLEFPSEWEAQQKERKRKKAERAAKHTVRDDLNPDLDAADARAQEATQEAAALRRMLARWKENWQPRRRGLQS
jgi:hypothetical protein